MPREAEATMDAGRLGQPRHGKAELRLVEQRHPPRVVAEEIEHDALVGVECQVAEIAGGVEAVERGHVDDPAGAIDQGDVEPLLEGRIVGDEEQPAAVGGELRLQHRAGHHRTGILAGATQPRARLLAGLAARHPLDTIQREAPRIMALTRGLARPADATMAPKTSSCSALDSASNALLGWSSMVLRATSSLSVRPCGLSCSAIERPMGVLRRRISSIASLRACHACSAAWRQVKRPARTSPSSSAASAPAECSYCTRTWPSAVAMAAAAVRSARIALTASSKAWRSGSCGMRAPIPRAWPRQRQA